MAKTKRFTIYDAMEEAGVFDKNPANAQARNNETGEVLYKGPVEFPKMLFHPEGEMKVIVPAVAEATPFGPKYLDGQSELIYQIANNAKEEKELLGAGWHKSPAVSHGKRTGEAVVLPPLDALAAAEAEIAELKAKIAASSAASAKASPSIAKA